METQTLFFVDALSAAVCGVLLLVARSGRGTDPIAWWGVAMLLGAAGLVLCALPLPPLLTLDTGKALLLLTGPASWTAARLFVGRRPAPWRAVAGAVAWLLMCRFPAFRESDTAQIVVTCGIGSVYMLATALALRPTLSEGLPSSLPASVLLYVHAIVYAARAVLAAAGLDQPHDPIVIALLIEAQVHTVGMAIILLAMTKERAERDLETSLSDARAAADRRAQFVAHLGHEIRTPLNSIIGVGQLLRNDTNGSVDRRWQLDLLDAAGGHLLAIVNDVLDMAKIDAGRLDTASEPFSPLGAAEECLALVGPSATEKRLTIRLDAENGVPATVDGDLTRLKQILLNLLGNAVKFTPTGGCVTLRMHAHDALHFEVEDTGPGIPPDKQAMLFQEFSQLQLQDAGTGLGLSLSARLAERMGGSLRYVVRPNATGSLFRLTLAWPAA